MTGSAQVEEKVRQEQGRAADADAESAPPSVGPCRPRIAGPEDGHSGKTENEEPRVQTGENGETSEQAEAQPSQARRTASILDRPPPAQACAEHEPLQRRLLAV